MNREEQTTLSSSNPEPVSHNVGDLPDMEDALDQLGTAMLTALWIALDAYTRDGDGSQPPVVIQSAAIAAVLCWNPTTTKTYFKRLAKKGLIKTRRKMSMFGMGFMVTWIHPEVEAFLDANAHMVNPLAESVVPAVIKEALLWK